MVRAIHEWCEDNALTPHLMVVVNDETRVPRAYVKDGEIVLNMSYSATKDLHIDNDAIMFNARFGGVQQNIYVPMNAVRGIFSRENGQGMFFELSEQEEMPGFDKEETQVSDDEKPESATKKKRPTLTIVK
jgi:stringent starvation protein B